MMIQRIDTRLQRAISRHTRGLGMKRFFQNMGYERSAELPLIVSRLEPDFDRSLKMLDLGSGDSVFPSYILKRSNWDITCIDKFAWVHAQQRHARKCMGNEPFAQRFHIVEQDFLEARLPAETFDIITNISVIEHFENGTDSVAMRESARLLKPGGRYILTTLINEGYPREFHVKSSVYGEEYGSRPVFFQRHYDCASLDERVIVPSGLSEVERLYFGDYGFQFFERFMALSWPWKAAKILYQWATPAFSRRFMSYRNYPVSRAGMHMYTASGVFLVMTKA